MAADRVAGLCPAAVWSLDYGLTDSTSDEILAAYGWHGLNVSWLWYLLPSVLFFRSLTPASRDQRGRHYTDIAVAVLTAVVAVVSAVWEGKGLGYSAIVLFISLGMIMTLALKRRNGWAATSLLSAH